MDGSDKGADVALMAAVSLENSLITNDHSQLAERQSTKLYSEAFARLKI
jgi:hypothetical protein